MRDVGYKTQRLQSPNISITSKLVFLFYILFYILTAHHAYDTFHRYFCICSLPASLQQPEPAGSICIYHNSSCLSVVYLWNNRGLVAYVMRYLKMISATFYFFLLSCHGHGAFYFHASFSVLVCVYVRVIFCRSHYLQFHYLKSGSLQ